MNTQGSSANSPFYCIICTTQTEKKRKKCQGQIFLGNFQFTHSFIYLIKKHVQVSGKSMLFGIWKK